MNNKIIQIYIIFLSIMMISTLNINKYSSANCDRYTTQLRNLLNYMCNNIADGGDNLLRDDCVDCFQRASVLNNNQPSLIELSNCATNYLPDTRYEICINQIDDPANAITTNNQCVSGYCRFVTCIRRSNADLLVAQCYGEAIIDNDAILEVEQVNLVKNITSCILARSRCASFNPITGQPQTNTFNTTVYDTWGKSRINTVPLYNSLQVTPSGDLRVIAFPGNIKIQNYFCSVPNIQQSSWMDYSC